MGEKHSHAESMAQGESVMASSASIFLLQASEGSSKIIAHRVWVQCRWGSYLIINLDSAYAAECFICFLCLSRREKKNQNWKWWHNKERGKPVLPNAWCGKNISIGQVDTEEGSHVWAVEQERCLWSKSTLGWRGLQISLQRMFFLLKTWEDRRASISPLKEPTLTSQIKLMFVSLLHKRHKLHKKC